jgi:dTDP-4-dehydrorhamnose reductase
MTIVIFGAGFLGTRLADQIPDAVLSRADVTDRDAVIRELRVHGASAAVKCAGKTGKPNVDWCDAHPLETQRANVVGPLVLAEACAGVNAYLLHMGSGCIFYGPSPSPGGWREDDFANPCSFYSRTKYAADLSLSKLPNVGIARLRMPIDGRPGARNLITKLASYEQVIDVENSVTVVDDLVGVVRALVGIRATGVFHATNPGTMRHRDLLRMYRELVDPSHEYTLIDEGELVARGLATHARSNCVLASPRLAEVGIAMRPIDVALRDAVTQYARARRG